MTVSARLSSKTQLALMRYCKAHGLTKTQALERGIALLLRHEGQAAHHPAFTAFERLSQELPYKSVPQSRLDSIDALKRHLHEKYPA